MEHRKKMETGIIRSNEEVAPGHKILRIELSGTFGDTSPGQFVMLRQEDRRAPFLARPFSIYTQERMGETVHLELLYRVVGKGTTLMWSLRKGDRVMLLGPLGRGFDSAENARKVALVAGGVGVAPLVCYAEHVRNQDPEAPVEMTAYLGARTGDLLLGLDRLEVLCDKVKIATDDGSHGSKGMVTELFRQDLNNYRAPGSVVKTCGPWAMTAAMAAMVEGTEIDCQVSLEERMACGIGACLGCAVKASGSGDEPGYRRVCKDGPVFDTGEINWNGD